MEITKATIRTTDDRTHIDATIDGALHESFIVYPGNTREHENAALVWLVNTQRVQLACIAMLDDRAPTCDGYDVTEHAKPERDARNFARWASRTGRAQ